MASVLQSHQCFALRTEDKRKYLQSVYREQAGGVAIEASAVAVAGSVRARFFVEAPKKKEVGLVHVRCCYNNKYWVAVKDTRSGCWVIGTADEPNEDLTSPSCTLFSPMAHNHPRGLRIRFRHPSLQKFVGMSSIANPLLQLAEGTNDMTDLFTVIGLLEQKELPKYIALKESGGNYFGVRCRRDLYDGLSFYSRCNLPKPPKGPVLVFHTTDIGDAGVICTVHTNDDGTVRIQSTKDGYFWKRDHHDWIIPHEGETRANDADTLFEVTRGDGFIALKNLGNGKYCKIRRDSMEYEYLSAEESSMSRYTKLQFAEPITDQKIYEAEYYHKEERIYDIKIVKSVAITRTNNGDRDLTGSITFSQKTQAETKWQTSVSEKTGLEGSLSIGTGEKSPVQANMEVKKSKEKTSSQGTESSQSKGDEVSLTHAYTVPPGQTMAAQLVATQSRRDIPYSYKQRITLTNGDKITSIHDDGICTVKENYGFNITESKKPDEIKRMQADRNPVLTPRVRYS